MVFYRGEKYGLIFGKLDIWDLFQIYNKEKKNCEGN